MSGIGKLWRRVIVLISADFHDLDYLPAKKGGTRNGGYQGFFNGDWFSRALRGFGFYVPSLLVLGAAFSSTQTPGQIFTTLYSLGNATDQAGGRPAAPLLLGPDGLLYGSTSEGVGAGILRGALFKITQDGSQLTVLKQFTNALDGSRPQGRLQLSGDTLFGITTLDGPLGGGTVFAARTNGDNFRVLAPLPAHSFEDKHGSPVGGLTLAGSNLFGVTPIGGKSNCGAIFRLDASGANFQILKEFTGKDGAGPCGDLVTAGSVLYGTTVRGDSFFGSIFRMNDDGTGFEVLKRFERVAPDFAAADGANPSGGLVLAGDTLYGSTVSGGLDPTVGGLFKLNIDGSGYEIFQGLSTAESSYASVGNIEGPPTLAGDLLYFVASSKTLDVSPSVWRVKTNGTELAQVCYARGGCVRGVSLAQGSLFGVATGTSFSEPV